MIFRAFKFNSEEDFQNILKSNSFSCGTDSPLRNTPQKLLLSERLSAEKLKVSSDTENVYRIFGLSGSIEKGTLLFADFLNR